MKILILGVNGFIGNALAKRLLKKKIDVYGFDLFNFNIVDILEKKNFFFKRGNIFNSHKYLQSLIKKVDIVVPLIAIATPNVYIKDPLRIFHLDFEENLKIIKICAKYNKRIIFPSTSEVYGMNNEKKFDEYDSNLVLGPITKNRWIYSCSKQLLDRVLMAMTEKKMIKSTIFRPFNWIGPNLDTLKNAQLGNGRVLTIFINKLLKNENINLVNGGYQKRSFTYIDDGINALMKIILGNQNYLNGRIYNIGNPKGNISIKKLCQKTIKLYNKISIKKYKGKVINISEDKFYGKSYQDMKLRIPNIDRARKELGWKPITSINESLIKTLKSYITN
jgi:nucleoside-diphosphate-sugar epimerase